MSNAHADVASTEDGASADARRASEPAAAPVPPSRRSALRQAGRVGLGVALAGVPAAFFLSSARTAHAQDDPVANVLSFALTLEYLEWQYYEQALSGDGALSFPSGARAKFTEIRDHELAHVRFLEGQLGLEEDENLPAFDFTAGGTFDPGPFEDYATFLLLAQAFEDTGVRAYQGGAPALIGTGALTPALQIHATEAGHAAVVRRLVAAEGLAPEQDAWIEGAGAQAPDTLAGYMDNAIYTGEDNTSVAGSDVAGIGDYSDELVTEAYDEPLGMSAVNAIAEPFIGGGSGGGGNENLITDFENPAVVGSGQPISAYGGGIISQGIEDGQFVVEAEEYGGNGNFPGISIKLDGIGFDTPVDFTETPVLQLDIQVSEDANKALPVHAQILTDEGTIDVDDYGSSEVVPADGNLATYYFDATGATGGDLSAVNEIIFQPNAGIEGVTPFNGTYSIDNLRRRESVPNGG